ncbi:MAG TPA: response regulator [Dissulfurispiraceae bacterium]|nr:response regulator [Dissulfurispiraceae bacterium]
MATILLIDDQESVLQVEREMLEMLGYSVLYAQTGTEALSLFDRQVETISLVILDYSLPEMSSSEILARLKQISPAVKVMIASGHDREGKVSVLLNRGCAFLQKPFSLQELSSRIEACLNS